MLKRVGVLALILSAGAAFVQPTVAFAEDRAYHAAYSGDRRGDSRDRREYREPVRRENRDWDRGARVRIGRNYDRGYGRRYYAPAQTYYHAPAPNCNPY